MKDSPFLNEDDFFKSITMDEGGDLRKAKRIPVGTISHGYKKIAEGKWVPVKKGREKIENRMEKLKRYNKLEADLKTMFNQIESLIAAGKIDEVKKLDAKMAKIQKEVKKLDKELTQHKKPIDVKEPSESSGFKKGQKVKTPHGEAKVDSFDGDYIIVRDADNTIDRYKASELKEIK